MAQRVPKSPWVRLMGKMDNKSVSSSESGARFLHMAQEERQPLGWRKINVLMPRIVFKTAEFWHVLISHGSFRTMEDEFHNDSFVIA